MFGVFIEIFGLLQSFPFHYLSFSPLPGSVWRAPCPFKLSPLGKQKNGLGPIMIDQPTSDVTRETSQFLHFLFSPAAMMEAKIFYHDF